MTEFEEKYRKIQIILLAINSKRSLELFDELENPIKDYQISLSSIMCPLDKPQLYVDNYFISNPKSKMALEALCNIPQWRRDIGLDLMIKPKFKVAIENLLSVLEKYVDWAYQQSLDDLDDLHTQMLRPMKLITDHILLRSRRKRNNPPKIQKVSV